jgi:hypothetical protein
VALSPTSSPTQTPKLPDAAPAVNSLPSPSHSTPDQRVSAPVSPPISRPAEPTRDRGETLDLPLSQPQSTPSAAIVNPSPSLPIVATTPPASARSESSAEERTGDPETKSAERESDNAA